MNRIIKRVLPIVAYAWAGCATAGPITDTVSVNGLEWAQADLFVGLSWSDINVVCPAGVCGSGSLNGFDMSGWVWATIDDINQLFNHYIGSSALGPGPDFWAAPNDFTVSTAFFADGWRASSDFIGNVTMGWASDDTEVAPVIGEIDVLGFFGPIHGDSAETEGRTRVVFPMTDTGAWFFSDGATNNVPSPATIMLIAIGLVSLGFSRKKYGVRALSSLGSGSAIR